MELLNIALPIVYALVGVALVWFIIELVMTVRTARKTVKSVKKQIDPTLENVGKITASLEPAVANVNRLQSEVSKRKGMLEVELDEFLLVYRHLSQLVKRSRQPLHVLTLEISGVTGERRQEAMKILGKAICSALRESDICSRYGDCRYLVLLLGVREGNGAFIAGRVLGAFDNLYNDDGCVVNYQIQQVNE